MIKILLVAAVFLSLPPRGDRLPTGSHATVGSCIGETGPFDLSRVLFLENRIAELDVADGRIQVELDGQIIRIRRLNSESAQVVSTANVGALVGNDSTDADVFVKIAMLNGEPLLYWRETFQHRIYRQGLFRFSGTSLTRLCEGRGGSERSH